MSSSIQIVNFDRYAEADGVDIAKHGGDLPSNVRCIICGPSASGKSNVAFNMIFDPNGLKFHNLYVFSKSMNQPKYRFLAKVMQGVPEIGFYPCSENESLVHPNKAEPHSIFLFDDVACEKHDNIRNYFTMGRHNNIDTIYLAQTYSRVPKQLIRDNANYLILFRMDETNLKHLYSDHVNTDMTFDRFKVICNEAWNRDKHSFLVINKEKPLNAARYSINFNRAITV